MINPNIPCGVYLDLLPLYLDSMVSKETGKCIKQHLDSCDCCRAAYEQMSLSLIPENHPNNDGSFQNSTDTMRIVPSNTTIGRKLKRRFRLRNGIRIVIFAYVFILLMILVLVFADLTLTI